MYYYRLYELNIASDIKFIQLVSIDECTPDVTIHAGVIPKEKLVLEEGLKGHVGDDESWYVHPAFDFLIKNGNELIYQTKEIVDPDFLDYLNSLGRGFEELDLCQWLLSVGMGLAGLQRGMIPMHCSALSKAGKAILVCGQSGAGKSTITSQLLKEGWNLMADDISFIETRDGVTYAKPAFPFQKLNRDMAIKEGYNLDEEIYVEDGRDKFMVRYRGEFSTKEMPLKHIIVMGVSDKEELIHERATGMDAFYFINSNMYIYRMLGNAKYSPTIVQRCMKIASNVTVDVIVRPIKGGTLRQELATVQEAVK